MDTTATPNAIVSFLKGDMLPKLIANNGKYYSSKKLNLNPVSVARSNARRETASKFQERLKTLSFVQHLSSSAKASYLTNVDKDFFSTFMSRTSNSTMNLVSSDQGKELFANMIKGFYQAFPFVEKRKVILGIRDNSISLLFKDPVTSAQHGRMYPDAPDWLVSAVDTFNNSSRYFKVYASTYQPLESPVCWKVQIGCVTRHLRVGNYSTLSHPVNEFHGLVSPLLRRANTQFNITSYDPVHLNEYLIADFEHMFSFMKSLLEHLPCKTLA